MRKIKHCLLLPVLGIVCILLANGNVLCAAERHSLGLLSGYGRPTLPERYTYNTTFVELQYSYVLHSVRKWDFELLVMPQYNFTQMTLDREMTQRDSGYEVGFTAGVAFRNNVIPDRLSLYVALFLGPMYLSDSPPKQSGGFNFSDNMALGMSLRLVDRLYFDLRPGFKHTSNANIRKPNGGLNQWWITMGFYYRFGSKFK